VTIPANVTNIGEYAFGYNSHLTSATVPGGAYAGEYNFFHGFANDPNLANVTIANGVTSIVETMFEDTSSLSNLTIPASVTNIGQSTFQSCSYLTNVTLSYGLTSIEEEAFSDTSLTTVTIPASVTNLGAYAFAPIGALPSFYFAGNAPIAVSAAFYGNGTVYYLPGTAGWSNTYSGYPAVLWNPQIQTSGPSFGVQNNQFGFNITGTSNIPIVVQACANLASPVWTPLQSLTLTNGSYYFSEPLQTNSTARFYRISAP